MVSAIIYIVCISAHQLFFINIVIFQLST